MIGRVLEQRAPAAAEAEGDGSLGSVLVVGGGIAGMTASLDLAQSGFLVHLVTEEPSIGGRMAQLDKTFPTNDCAMCMLGPKMTDCQAHPNIILHTNSELAGLDGGPGRFRAGVRHRPRYVDIEECTACGDCEGVCPVTVPDRFNEGMNGRRAIYKLFPQAVPNKYLVEKRGAPPCRETCPAGTNVQGYIALIAQAKFTEALEVVRRRMPFAAICGRVCHRPCETDCNRREYDEPLAIAALKRAAADFGEDAPPALPEEKRAEKVAVVGAGPGGLAAALDLALAGFRVTVLDSAPEPGGTMLAAIPHYRLGPDVIRREIDWVLSHGITFQGSVTVGRDVTLDRLRRDYDAVLLAVGATGSRGLDIDGADLPGVLSGLDFLRRANAAPEAPPEVGRRVAVVGGGNVAIDVARTALRLGAEEVCVVYRRSEAEMPAQPDEVRHAGEEGVDFRLLCNPTGIDGDQRGGVTSMTCIEMELGPEDESGRRRPVPRPGSEFRMEVDTVILAIGQATDLDFLAGSDDIETAGGLIGVDPLTMQTGAPGVFACGDVVSGPASVVEAVAGGHEAAESIGRHLRGEDLAAGRTAPDEEPERLGPPEGVLVEPAARRVEELEPAAERRRDFREVGRGYTQEQAVAEAERCLNCSICCECLQCVTKCEKDALRHDEVESLEEIDVGAVIVASGMSLHEGRLEGEYGYGVYPNVVTSLEFERLLSSTGPTAGELKRPSDGRHPRRVAFIQCVGSRDLACGAEYCSAICCMYSTKEAVIAREHDPDVEATIFYLDIRAHGKGFDRYVDQAEEAYGVRFVRSMISTVKEDQRTGDLRIRYYSGGALHDEEFDLVVLAVGVRPPEGLEGLAAVCGFDLDDHGFARWDEVDPCASTREGVFLAGAVRGPQDIPETVMTAGAAASAASRLLAGARGTMERVLEYPPERDVSSEEPRIGVFICRCGINIAGVVDVERVMEHARRLPGVVHAEENLYTCSQDSLQKIGDTIVEQGLNRIVVASCSIRTHERLFRDALRQAGLNQFLFEMANIRDQCSWVHREAPDAATVKACDLVSMAASKATHHQALQLHPVPVVPRALVVGGGIAGMTAALALADQGFGVYIVERASALGGNLRHLRHTLEGTDVRQLLRRVVERVENHPLVEVILEHEVAEASGHTGHFVTRLRPADAAPDASGDGGPRELEHAVVIVATGARELEPGGLYGHGDPRVTTALSLESMLHDDPGGLEGRRRFVFIQCAGSRDDDRGYCSRTCCSHAVKDALELKRRLPDAEVHILYRDIRTFGTKERYYRRARETGVNFVCFDRERPPRVETGDELVVRVRDELQGEEMTLRPDLVVLSAATVAPDGIERLATALKLPLTEDGFFLESHIKLGPMDFSSGGLYLCGSAHWPKFISEAVYQAWGAASRAATILSRENLMAGGVVAVVDPDRCAACLACVRACPYDVPEIGGDDVAEIEAVQCQGCGTCAGECPAKAIELQHFTDVQVAAEVRGLFRGHDPGEAAQ